MRPWCQDGSTRRCQRRRPGSSPGGRSRSCSQARFRGAEPCRSDPRLRRGHIPEGVGFAAATRSGLLMVGTVVCTHPSGVRFPGAPLVPQSENRSRGSRSRGSLKAPASRPQLPLGGSTRSRTRLVARLGCLPGEAGSTPVESAQTRRSSAEPSTTLRRWGTEVRILPARCEQAEIGKRRQLRSCDGEADAFRDVPRRRRGSERGIPLGGIPLANKPRRQADWVGAALIRRWSVVRFHGRRSPRSSAEEQRASTPRGAGSIPAGEYDVAEPMVPHATGRRGDWPTPPTSGVGDRRFESCRPDPRSPAGERRAVEERLSSRAS